MKKSQIFYEPDCMTAENNDEASVPKDWFLVLDCEGELVCAVPPGSGSNPRNNAQIISNALNFAWKKAETDEY